MWQGGMYCSLAPCGPGPPFRVASFSASVLLLKPPPPLGLGLSECLFFFGVFLSMLARAAGP